MDMKRFFLYAIVIAALALAGCGGNGGGQTAMPDPDPDPTCPDGQTGTPPNCVTPPPPITPPSNELVMGIVTANEKDNSATNPAHYDDAARPNNMADTSTPPVITLNNDLTVETAIDGMKTTVMEGTTKYALQSEMPPSVTGFAGTLHRRDRTESGVRTEDMVTIYESRAAPGDKKYSELFATGNDGSIPGTTITNAWHDGNIAAPGNNEYSQLSFAASSGAIQSVGNRFSATDLPTGNSQTFTYYTSRATFDTANTNQDPTATDILKKRFDGTFFGIPGNFACAAAAGAVCSVETDGSGKIRTMAGGWSFTPDATGDGAKHIVRSVSPDMDYLSFGYWVKKTTKGTNDPEYNVGVSYGGMRPYPVGQIVNLEKTASYTGGAAGQFVRNMVASDGTATPVDGGAFTADAMLEANFGGTSIAADKQFSISGTINNFRDAQGQAISAGWNVTLDMARFSTYSGGSHSEYVTTFTGNTMAGGPTGKWGGTFYGPGSTESEASSGVLATDKDAYPIGVAGGFDAHFTNGHAIGAFGAELD